MLHRFGTWLTKGVFFCLMTALALPVHAITPSDEFYEDQWYLEQIAAPAAWDSHTGSGEVVVAVLDTGVDLDHPDLEANIWINEGEVAGDGIDNDRNGYIDDVNGFDFVDEDGTPYPTQGEAFEEGALSHGTAIAGIIGAVGDNEEGISGINWDVQLMSVRILDNEGFGDSNLARKGVDYAVENGADVINLSFTGFEHDERLRLAIERAYEAGVVVVAAMGNTDGGGTNIDQQPIFPACYGEHAEEDWILGVGATDRSDTKSSFSNYGSTCTDISAPGQSIMTTVYQEDRWEVVSQGWYEEGWSGTSVASPVVAGAAALLKSAHPSLTPDDIKLALRLSADPVRANGEAQGKTGAGRLNLENALALSATFVDPEEDALSTASIQLPSYRIAVAPESGDPPIIRVMTNSGSDIVTEFNAYQEGFTGGVRVAMGDVDGDGEEEIITVPGPGGRARVRIFSLEGTLESEFDAFEQDLRSGFYIAVADMNADGVEEIGISTDAGGEARIRLFTHEGEQMEQEIRPFTDLKGDRSTRIAMGDVDGDEEAELIVTLGPGYAPQVRVFEAQGTQASEFLAYAESYDKGVFVASGDLDGDGDDEIVTGTDNGGGPQVQIFDGSGAWLGTFFAYDASFRGGVRLSVGNLSEWPGASIITAAGPGGGPHVRVYNGYADLIGTFFSGDESNRAGINSASWSL